LNKKWDEDKDLLYSEVTGAEIEKVIKLFKKETCKIGRKKNTL
jgi:hypothetical protein